MSQRPENIKVLAVCGLGMGTSLILRMTLESVLNKLNIKADVEHMDLSAAKSMRVDVVVGQEMHVQELNDTAKIVVSVDDFIDENALELKLVGALEDAEWI